LSRKIVEFAQRTEPEWAERVGEGGGGREELSEECVGKGSKEFRVDLRMGVRGERYAWLSVVEGEGGRRELSTDGEGTGRGEEDGEISSWTPTTAIWGMWRSSEAIK